MRRIHLYFIILVISFPFLASFETNPYNPKLHAIYQSPEGILFKSFSTEWNQEKLIDLYHELVKNKHGNELKQLRAVEVIGTTLDDSFSKGSYDYLNKTIKLYQGDQYQEPSQYQETLSHEYGHHFAYHYFPSHHLPLSKWQKIRNLNLLDLRWDAFWNYQDKYHAIYPQEVFADDYVLLYGATKEVDPKDVETNEAFYLRTEHENQQISNVLENSSLHSLLEEETGIEIDQSRLLHMPTFSNYKDAELSFTIKPKINIAYRLNLTLNDSKGNTFNYESYQIHRDESEDELIFHLEDLLKENLSNYEWLSASIDVIDLDTSIGFETEEWKMDIEDI
ncbi:hypothetical protein FS935_02515 [Metabacillus litoralis]|uniref:Uncharacterized protein n=1 Tax=Metabacillus litoralis TaxID=152268 RepID=A0A5C6W805_9BACI|nr:hypothetical protein [Metabacillus litoralis]TXC93085.1 hypothetical protein FS935_02515 [Metabacillus litoralis]